MKRLALIIVTLLATAASVHALPTGAVKLAKNMRFSAQKVACGKIGRKWLPGTLLNRQGWFVSHLQQKKNFSSQAASATGRNRAGLLRRARSFGDKAKSQASACAGGPSTPGNGTTAIRFNLSSAVGLALGSASANSFGTEEGPLHAQDGSPHSNLKKVKPDGSTEEALSSGQTSIRRFLIAPNNKLYIVFSARTKLETGEPDTNGCLLAEVNTATGVPSCLDNEIAAIQWLGSDGQARNKSIQFDGAGAMYYAALKDDGKVALRRFKDGAATDLINDNISVGDFLVQSDGTVILYGYTTSSQAHWIRKINTGGGLQTVKNLGGSCNTGLNFIRIFPDNKVYFGLDDCSASTGVYRMEQDVATLEADPWMGSSCHTDPDTQQLVCDRTPVAYDCSTQNSVPLSQGCGAYVKALHRTPDGKIFALSGGTDGRLFRYYDVVNKPATAVAKVRVFQGVIGYLLLAGLNSSDANILTLFNTTDASETQLIGPESEIEIYHLNYAAGENKIMFDGLRFSDNKYVIGQVDLNTMLVSASQTGSTKLEDFQTF